MIPAANLPAEPICDAPRRFAESKGARRPTGVDLTQDGGSAGFLPLEGARFAVSAPLQTRRLIARRAPPTPRQVALG
jgi:hypothetical protein